MLISSTRELRFAVTQLPSERLPRKVLMVEPDHFQVEYVINPHMEGSIGEVDAKRARTQWEAVRATYATLGFRVDVANAMAGLPDMVFCANQTLPGLDQAGRERLMLSQMHATERQGEVEHFRAFFADRGYELRSLRSDARLEGCGDVLWHHRRRLLWAGTGFRSDLGALADVCELFGVHAVWLELVDPQLYHLDTCLSILDERTAVWVPSAFSARSQELVTALFDRLIEAPRWEAVSLLAANAHSPDGRHVLIQSGCHQTIDGLKSVGFEVVELETGEFLKAGGSVFCMKQMYW